MSIFIDRIKNRRETVKNPLFENKYSYGKIILDQTKCTLCGLCKEVCPVQAISLQPDGIIVDDRSCIYCNICVNKCINGALSMSTEYKLVNMEHIGNKLKETIYQRFNRSLVIRSVDTGSCNACMLELAYCYNTFWDLSRFGISFAASPRHSDAIIVTGPVTLNMKEALLKTYEAMSEPRIVIGMGACSFDNGIYKQGYGVTEPLNKILPVDLYIAGCPPSPQAVIFGLLKLLKKNRFS